MVVKVRPYKYAVGEEYGDLDSMRMPDDIDFWRGPLWTHSDAHIITQIGLCWQQDYIEVILRFGIKPDKK